MRTERFGGPTTGRRGARPTTYSEKAIARSDRDKALEKASVIRRKAAQLSPFLPPLPQPNIDAEPKVRSGPPEFAPLAELPPLPLEKTEIDRLPEPEGVLQGWWNAARDTIQGRASTREVGRARRVVKAVNALAGRFAEMSDEELAKQTDIFRRIIREKTSDENARCERARRAFETASPEMRDDLRVELREAQVALYKAESRVLDGLLPEAFAVVREAAFRATGMFPFEVQVVGGALMHRGLIAEMYTGEGKTLAAVMPTYLAALVGRGFHVVTVNDYLARRDAKEMGAIYGFLGLSVGVLQANGEQYVRDATAGALLADSAPLRPVSRKEAYQADITYGTPSELAFDYLRDNGVRELGDRVQRPLYGVLIDEIDAVLIDEARVPMIIAEPGAPPNVEQIELARDIVSELEWRTDVEWDQEDRWAALTEKGIDKVSAKLGIDNLYTIENTEMLGCLQDALQARFLFRRDEDYTVIDGRVSIVGRNGHALPGRRYVQGLHQAIEAKENVEILPDNRTRASITMREYFGRYFRHAGMSGTALSAHDVFARVYGVDVARVPQRKPLIRVDHPDRVFATQKEKHEGFLDEVARAHESGRPILIGVEWTKTAEEIVAALAERGIQASLLTAKNDAEEAEVIANAGRIGAVTVATSRGGRGVDIRLGGHIRLGGNVRSRTEALMRDEGLSKREAVARASEEQAIDRANVLALGGLYVIGYEHLDSRRRDDQLRGRAGRQGDPGATVFFTSLEDAVYDGLKDVERFRKGEQPFTDGDGRHLTERALDRSERAVNEDIRVSVPYDDVYGDHRELLYAFREDVLAVEDCRPVVRAAIESTIENIFKRAFDASTYGQMSEALARDVYMMLSGVLPLPEHGPPPDWSERMLPDIRKDIDELVRALLARRDQAVGEEVARVLERAALVNAIDEGWMFHLDALAHLRAGIGLRSYAQRDPRIEFRRDATLMFDDLLGDVDARLTADLLKQIPYVP
jgi:preprotein translocase subunit SecA